MDNKIGFTTVTFRKKSRREVCEIAAENNIKYLEWGGDIHLPPDDMNARNEAVSLQREYGLSCASYGSYYRLGMNDFELWEKIVGTARAVGADIIRIWAGSKSSAKTTDDELMKMVEETRKLADAAEGLTVAFEFHKNTYNDCGKCTADFLKAVGRENVKTYWQPMSAGADLENLAEVMPYLVTVHIFQWDRIGKRYSLKKGERIWREYLAAVRASEREVNFIMEFVKRDSPRQFKRDAKTLFGILDGVR